MTIEDIVRLSKEEAVSWTRHIFDRLLERGISVEDVETALANGEIIEQYPTDYPFPSCLVLGHTATGQALHVVCGSNGKNLRLITAYFPNIFEWTDDFKKRRNV